MQQTITITPHWQIHIPINIRKILNLTKPTKAVISVEKNTILIKPKESEILKMAGTFKLKKNVKLDLNNVRDYINYSEI